MAERLQKLPPMLEGIYLTLAALRPGRFPHAASPDSPGRLSETFGL